MSKKLIFIASLLVAIIFSFSVTFCFATDGNDGQNMMNNAVNGVRDAVGGGCDKATWAQYTYIILDNDLKPKQPKNLVEYAKYLLEILKYRTSSCHID